jgi:1-acyl-sn-glycerol-3-phosphate acyltransferase
MRNLLLYLWFGLIVKPVSRLFLGVSVHGREHLRIAEPTIFVANHNSHLDAAVLMDLMRLRDLPKVRPVAAADYFEQGPIRGFIWTRCMNVLPIRRDKVTRRHNPLQAMLDALDAGTSLILFPEGTRGDPEKLGEFRTGIAHVLAKRPHTPVVPVYMRNLGFAMPRGDLIIVPMFCDVYVGPPRIIGGNRSEIMQHLTETFAALIAQADALRPTTVPADDR